MNRINFTPPRTGFQHTSDIMGHAADAVKRAYDLGFSKGELVGEATERARRRLSEGKALGIGFIIGFATCATVIALYVGWQS